MSAVTVYAQPAKPDMTKGGPFGKSPAGEPDQKIISKANLKKTEDENKPKVLGCGEQYEVDVTLTQDVKNCEGFDFTKMYEEALDTADKEIDKIQCPKDEDCIRHYWYGFLKWGCVDQTHAMAEVQEIITCAKSGSMVPVGYGNGSKQDKTKPVSVGGPPPKEPVESGEFITVNSNGKSNGFFLDCNTSFLASYTYEVKTDNANALEAQKNGDTHATEYSKVKNFKAYYDQAEQKAKEYHDQFRCKELGGAKCKLQPFKVLGGDIQVNGGAGTVTIIIYFEVECKK